MSARQDVYNAVVAALRGTTTAISYVAERYEPWWDWSANQIPGAWVQDMGVEKTPLSYPMGTTAVADMEGVMTLKIKGVVTDYTNLSQSTSRGTLAAVIERVLLTDSTLSGKVADIWPISDEADEGVIDNHAWADLTFKVRYFYNHAST